MSYITREQSDYDGHPLELYRFSLGDQQWLFTSADQEITFGEDKYQPVFIQRGGFTRGGDPNKSSLEVEISASNPVVLPFRTGWLPGAMILTVYRHHHGDAEFAIIWKGRITNCRWSGSVAKLSSDAVFTLFRRAGLRRVYQVGCPHVLYGAACGVDPDGYQLAGAVTAVGGNQVEVAGAAALGAGYWIGGKLRAGENLRLIIDQSGGVLTLIDAVDDLAVGAAVTLWPGCGHDMVACDDKFANLDNYGGLPYLPGKNPFSGDALV